MPQYSISFPSDAMNEIPEEEMSDVAKAAHAVCQQAIDACRVPLRAQEVREIGFDPELDEMLRAASG